LSRLARQREQTARRFFIQRFPLVSDGGKDQVILGLIERLDGQLGKRQITPLSAKGFEDADSTVVRVVVKSNFRRGQLTALCLGDHRLGERVV
jgi:hypothetical protein